MLFGYEYTQGVGGNSERRACGQSGMGVGLLLASPGAAAGGRLDCPGLPGESGRKEGGEAAGRTAAHPRHWQCWEEEWRVVGQG